MEHSLEHKANDKYEELDKIQDNSISRMCRISVLSLQFGTIYCSRLLLLCDCQMEP